MKAMEGKEAMWSLVYSELKNLGVKLPKKIKPVKQDKKEILQCKNKIFGIDLSEQECVTESGVSVPKFISEATSFLKNYTAVEIGLFRKAGSVSRQRELRAKLEEGRDFESAEPNDVASLLKQWIRELPNPIVPIHLHDLFLKCQALEAEESQVSAVLLVCLLIPSVHLYTLKYLLNFLAAVAKESEMNKMDTHNLAIVMTPNLFPCDKLEKSSGDAMQSYLLLVEMLIVNANKVGEAPSNIAAQLAMKMHKENLDLDLELTPSAPNRRRRSGGVTELMNGIRKFVGNNLTPMHSNLSMEDTTKPKKLLQSKTPSKRKAEPDVSCSSAKKRALRTTISQDSNTSSFITPNKKRIFSSFSTPSNELSINTPGSHNRRKSFGLLRKRNKKKEKTNIKHSELETKNSLEDRKTRNNIENLNTKNRADCDVENSLNVSQGMLPYGSSPYFMVHRQTQQLKSVEIPVFEINEKKVVQGAIDKSPNLIEKSSVDLPQSFKRVASIRRSARRQANVTHVLKALNASNVLSNQVKQETATDDNAKKLKEHERKRRSLAFDESKLTSKTHKHINTTQSLKSANDQSFMDVTRTPKNKENENHNKAKSGIKSSLRRGRPNTITSGLKSGLCPKYSLDSTTSTDKPDNEAGKNLKETTYSQIEDLLSSLDNIGKENFFEEDSTTEVSLNTSKTENFDLSSDETLGSSFNSRQSMKRLSLLSDLGENLLCSPEYDSQRAKLRKRKSSTNAGILTPFSLLESGKNTMGRKSGGLNDIECRKELGIDKNEVWMNSAKFLSTYLTPDANSCKRQSIMHIIENNAGKVQANVQHFNFITNRRPTGGTDNNSTKTFNFITPEPSRRVNLSSSSNRSDRKILVARRPLRSCLARNETQSEPRVVMRNTRFNQSPMPLPPKFMVTEDSPSRSCCSPLKEVTNVSLNVSVGESNRSPKPRTPMKASIKTSENLVVPSNRVRKQGRHSLDGKMSKGAKPCRSESSPAMNKSQRALLHKKYNSQQKSKRPVHSYSFTSSKTCENDNIPKRKDVRLNQSSLHVADVTCDKNF